MPIQTNTDSRQVLRRRARSAAKAASRPGARRPPLIPKPGKPDRTNAKVLWIRCVGRTEIYMHATKGLRTRYIGQA